jgi:hypothetical protein
LERDIQELQKIRSDLESLTGLAAKVLGLTVTELDELRTEPLVNQRHIIDNLPREPASSVNVSVEQETRRSVIDHINDAMKALGVDLGLEGPPPNDVQ